MLLLQLRLLCRVSSPGIAGGPSLGMGAMMPAGGVSIIEWRPAIINAEPGHTLTIVNKHRTKYVAVELPNGADYMAPCGGKHGSWRSVLDIHSRQPIWVLPPGASACLAHPLYKCPPNGVACEVAIRVVRYTFSATYALREADGSRTTVTFGGRGPGTWGVGRPLAGASAPSPSVPVRERNY